MNNSDVVYIKQINNIILIGFKLHHKRWGNGAVELGLGRFSGVGWKDNDGSWIFMKFNKDLALGIVFSYNAAPIFFADLFFNMDFSQIILLFYYK